MNFKYIRVKEKNVCICDTCRYNWETDMSPLQTYYNENSGEWQCQGMESTECSWRPA